VIKCAIVSPRPEDEHVAARCSELSSFSEHADDCPATRGAPARVNGRSRRNQQGLPPAHHYETLTRHGRTSAAILPRLRRTDGAGGRERAAGRRDRRMIVSSVRRRVRTRPGVSPRPRFAAIRCVKKWAVSMNRAAVTPVLIRSSLMSPPEKRRARRQARSAEETTPEEKLDSIAARRHPRGRRPHAEDDELLRQRRAGRGAAESSTPNSRTGGALARGQGTAVDRARGVRAKARLRLFSRPFLRKPERPSSDLTAVARMIARRLRTPRRLHMKQASSARDRDPARSADFRRHPGDLVFNVSAGDDVRLPAGCGCFPVGVDRNH